MVTAHHNRSTRMARMARSTADTVELSIDRQGRLVIPRSLRAHLGAVPGIVRARAIEGGVVLEPLSSGSMATGPDGLPLLVLDEPVSNAEMLDAIDAARADR